MIKGSAQGHHANGDNAGEPVYAPDATFAGWERDALDEALAIAALPLTGWEFGRTGGHRTSFRCPELGLFVKLTTPSGVDDMAYESTVASWIGQTGLPGITLAPAVADQPVLGNFGAATFWRLVDAVPYDEVDMTWMGEALASFHAQEAPDFFRGWDPEGWSHEDLRIIRTLPGVEASTIERLEREAARILSRARELTADAPMVVLHGDPHAGNVVQAAPGQPLFCDFELAQLGPAEWDLSLVAVRVRRMGMSKDLLDQMLQGYGSYDKTMLETMVELRELRMAGGTRYAVRPTFPEQLALRTAGLGDGGISQWGVRFVPVNWSGNETAK
jgi:hypothetical protein